MRDKLTVASARLWRPACICLGRGIRLGSEQAQKWNGGSPARRRTGAAGQVPTSTTGCCTAVRSIGLLRPRELAVSSLE